MILKVRHKALRAFINNGETKNLNREWIGRIARICTLLDAASVPAGMNIPGFYLHRLKGSLEGFWSVRIAGNWRIIWRFDKRGNATDLDLLDYH